MNQTAIFWPMIAHAALVFAIYVLLGLRRRQAVMTGNAKVSQFRENRDEPAESLFVRNALENQFELPLLFYAVCLALQASGAVGALTLGLAWVFAVSRYVHTFIHVTSNRIRYRQPAFTVGFLALIALWVLLAVDLLSAG
ncbi:MAPEG family protein [Neoaquamicrobium sediminum]|uniref:MAPEG family protein n=1 Tax=Neoaquamicrobium sediminum TaxID=1849104 RepID=UPI001567C391|nr:MAPEG family protein [Mesorhizobium sediminum]